MSGRPVSTAALWRRGLLRSSAPALEKAIGAAIAEYLGSKTLEAWPSTLTLADGGELASAGLKERVNASLSERRVRSGLDWLVTNGWLRVVDARAGRTTVYAAAFPPGVFELVSGLHVVQGVVQPVQEGLHVVQGGPASDAPEVEVEVEKEGVQEDGSVQLNLETGHWRRARCFQCGDEEGEKLCTLKGGQFWCADHVRLAS